MARIAQVLHDVHALRSQGGEPLGIVHRDVTWDNILIAETELSRSSSFDAVYLNDFGLAHVRAWEALSLEETLQGAPRFLPPELKAGGQPSPASDVYQTALTLCFLLHTRDGGNHAHLFDEDFSNPVNDRARDLLRPFGAESALDNTPGNRPTALELSALLSK
jgi:serine/threonine protein kinase